MLLAYIFQPFTENKTLHTTYLLIGPSPAKNGQCTFTVWAPECKSVHVVLAASPELPWLMEKGEFGYWTVTIDKVTPGMQYWYKLDNEWQRPDPASRRQPE